jgi:rhodanese-related sulfurtransferase
VARALIDRGFTLVRPLHGGLDAWIAAGYPVAVDEEGTPVDGLRAGDVL